MEQGDSLEGKWQPKGINKAGRLNKQKEQRAEWFHLFRNSN
jgi:hypothetical protein